MLSLSLSPYPSLPITLPSLSGAYVLCVPPSVSTPALPLHPAPTPTNVIYILVSLTLRTYMTLSLYIPKHLHP